jgi:hypothetical protein
MNARGFICLYSGTPGECQNCGGFTGAEGGPFPGDSRYCSEDCYAGARTRTAQAAARMACCPECGFDNAEHDTGCTLTPVATP